MWKKFTKKMKFETKKNGIYNLKHGDYKYPITYKLIKDGRKNKVLHKKIDSKIPITMIHGRKMKLFLKFIQKKFLKFFLKQKRKL